MRLKTFIAALFVAGLAVSVAIAAPPPGKGKDKGAAASTTTTGTTTGTTTERKGKGSKEQQLLGCKPVVSLVLKGDFVSAGSGSFAMLVKSANKHGKSLKGKQATVMVDDKTKFKRRGKAELADLEAGDRLVAHVRACKAKKGEELAADAKLLARSVTAKPKKDKSKDGEDETTATTTTTTPTTTG
jgi:hypothetical protein